jgi:hypothetical protein
MKVREELRQLRTERDELQIRNDERLYSRGGFSKEKERLETKCVFPFINITPFLHVLMIIMEADDARSSNVICE